jgi:lipopolysaccharide biosynthesis glycosyltransferase
MLINRPLIFAIDRNYIQHLAVALESLYQNNKYKIDVRIIYEGLDKKDINNLNIICNRYGQEIIYYEINKNKFDGFKENYHFTKAMYFRLLIPELLDDTIQSAIYVDSDIVVNGNIKYLFELNLDNNKLAAVGNPNFSSIARLKLKKDAVYFDSGLLIFNLSIWRKENIHTRIIDYIRQNPDKLEYPDNDALNIVIDGNFLELSPKYSLQSNYIDCNSCDFNYFDKFGTYDDIFKNPLIIQYAGGVKPWHYLSNDFYKDLYWKYLKNTPYKNYQYSDINIKKIIIKWIYTIKKYFIRSL